jgi:uncharacterized membrane protein
VREHGVCVLLAAVSVAGIGVSAYLTWTHLWGVVPVCVGGGGGCAAVQTSRYAEISGIPVAALGLAAYAALLLSAALRGVAGVLAGIFVALVGTLFSAYLTWLEVSVIQAICQWCVASAVLMVLALVLSISRFRRFQAE